MAEYFIVRVTCQLFVSGSTKADFRGIAVTFDLWCSFEDFVAADDNVL
jgi:hypothetical protein